MKFLQAPLIALTVSLSAHAANADPLSTIQAFTLNDVKQAEAIYAANPSVPTYQAATQCLGWLDTTISASGGTNPLGNLAAPAGVASTVADLDVALNSSQSVPPIVYQFNAACGGYVEDLKAQAAKAAAGGVGFLGIKF